MFIHPYIPHIFKIYTQNQGHEIKAKFDCGLYFLFCSGVIPLYTLVGSGGIHILLTHSPILFVDFNRKLFFFSAIQCRYMMYIFHKQNSIIRPKRKPLLTVKVIIYTKTISKVMRSKEYHFMWRKTTWLW